MKLAYNVLKGTSSWNNQSEYLFSQMGLVVCLCPPAYHRCCPICLPVPWWFPFLTMVLLMILPLCAGDCASLGATALSGDTSVWRKIWDVRLGRIALSQW